MRRRPPPPPPASHAPSKSRLLLPHSASPTPPHPPADPTPVSRRNPREPRTRPDLFCIELLGSPIRRSVDPKMN
uniref:Uncharacterized protein n=1 Tax=Triticum urartu TaxID=4572 RepID=A0A8R7TCZ3_TRIUA